MWIFYGAPIKQQLGPYTFFGDRLFTCYHLSIHYVLSNQPTLELVMKAENLKGNKIQAVIEYINGTQSKIGRTAQKKKTYSYKSWRGAWKETKRYN